MGFVYLIVLFASQAFLNEFLFACLLIFGSSFEQISAKEEATL